MIMNVFGSNGNQEVGVTPNFGAAWRPGQWSHIACTRQDGSMKFYFNGVLLATGSYNFVLTPPASSHFTIGCKWNSTGQCEGLLDELRISNRERSAAEIFDSYVKGQGHKRQHLCTGCKHDHPS
jgi:hypothetical protein